MHQQSGFGDADEPDGLVGSHENVPSSIISEYSVNHADQSDDGVDDMDTPSLYSLERSPSIFLRDHRLPRDGRGQSKEARPSWRTERWVS